MAGIDGNSYKPKISTSYETQSLDTKRIFDEVTSHGYKKRYGDLYNLISDYLIEINASMENFTNWNVGNDNLISVITMGTFACLQTFSHSEDKKLMVNKYIEGIVNELNIYREPLDDTSFVNGLISCLTFDKFDLEKEKSTCVNQIPNFVNKIYANPNDYQWVQKHIDKLINSNNHFHNDFINMVTLCVYTFIKITESHVNSQSALSVYLEKLILLNLNTYDEYLYDNPNSRIYIEF